MLSQLKKKGGGGVGGSLISISQIYFNIFTFFKYSGQDIKTFEALSSDQHFSQFSKQLINSLTIKIISCGSINNTLHFQQRSMAFSIQV